MHGQQNIKNNLLIILIITINLAIYKSSIQSQALLSVLFSKQVDLCAIKPIPIRWILFNGFLFRQTPERTS